jgi:hypothetical protein
MFPGVSSRGGFSGCGKGVDSRRSVGQGVGPAESTWATTDLQEERFGSGSPMSFCPGPTARDARATLSLRRPRHSAGLPKPERVWLRNHQLASARPLQVVTPVAAAGTRAVIAGSHDDDLRGPPAQGDDFGGGRASTTRFAEPPGASAAAVGHKKRETDF